VNSSRRKGQMGITGVQEAWGRRGHRRREEGIRKGRQQGEGRQQGHVDGSRRESQTGIGVSWCGK
jgi:hypothetical protein